jgi:hypothetical protein
MENKPNCGIGIGIGVIGNIRKKFQWTFQLIEHTKNESGHEVAVEHPEFFIKLNHRPISEIDFINSKETVKKELSFSLTDDSPWDNSTHEYKKPNDTLLIVYRWLSEAYNFANENGEVKTKEGWGNWSGVLTMYTGCGDLLERWTMNRVVPLSVNFGELDYSSSDVLTIEVTLMYDEVKYESLATPSPVELLNDSLKELIDEKEGQ